MTRRRGTALPIIDAALLVGVIGLQFVLLQIAIPSVAVGALGVAAISAIAAGTGLRRLLRIALGVIVLLLPVGIARAVLDGFSGELARWWSVYFCRIAAAVIVAFAYLRLVGIPGVQRGIRALLVVLPRRAAYTVEMIVTTALFLIPIVGRAVVETQRAARLRFGRSRSFGYRVVAVVRTVFVTLLELPSARAEAMVIRGAIEDPD